MKRTLALVSAASLLILSTHRLPAPIQEVPQSPTPATAARPKKSASKPKASSGVALKPQPRLNATPAKHRAGPYAGIWRGVINCSIWGNIEHRIIIDDSQKFMTLSKIGSGPGGANGTAAATIGPDGLSAQLPGGLHGKWSLQPNADGKTARVTLTGFMLNSSAVFTREQ
jgi:hypothetical protein